MVLTPADVEEFLEFLGNGGVDETASNAFYELSEDLQEEIISRGALVGRNPSAMLIGRIRDAKRKASSSAPAPNSKRVKVASNSSGRSSQGDHLDLALTVENFIEEEGIDSKAADALRELNPGLQAQVLDRGTLAGGKNPSAMLLGRIRDAKASQSMPAKFLPRGRPEMTFVPMQMPMQMPVQSFRPRAKVRNTIKPVIGGAGDVEEFIAGEGVDDKAADALRELSPGLQQVVMSRGPLSGKNPSAMLIGRIRDARSTGVMESQVEDFILDQGVDDKAAASLRELDPHMQEEVINRGPVSDGRNPSAVLIGRIRDMKRQWGSPEAFYPMMQMQPMMMMNAMMNPRAMTRGRSNSGNAVEAFILESGVDEKAAQELRGAGRAIQQKVMQEGELIGRNPSAMLIGRIKKAR